MSTGNLDKAGRCSRPQEEMFGEQVLPLIGTERDIEHAITRLADAGTTHFVANPAIFTTPEEHARTIAFLGSL